MNIPLLEYASRPPPNPCQTDSDISETKSAITDPLVAKRPDCNLHEHERGRETQSEGA